jgi:hypothetical protein
MPNPMLVIIQEREPIPLRLMRPDASRSLEELLGRAMVKNRRERIADMDALKGALAAIAAEPPPGAPVTDLEWNDGGTRRSRPNIETPPRPKPRPRRTTSSKAP